MSYIYIDIYEKDGRWYWVRRGYTRSFPMTVTSAAEAEAYLKANLGISQQIKCFWAELIK